jgi:hypothetical protein
MLRTTGFGPTGRSRPGRNRAKLACSRKTAKLEFGLSPKEIAMGNRDKQKKEKKKPKKTPVPKLAG